MKQRVGQYLVASMHAAGVNEIFGVPGDFNLAFLDDIVAHPSVKWIGNTNELNASYAADGYARVNGLGALVTTFGVGELSAVNGIAGAYAERVPVIAITGAPTRAVEKAGKYVHHSLGEGTFDDYRKMFTHITATQGYITPENATSEIPRLIQTAVDERRPVHIHLPIDVALTEIQVSQPFELQPTHSQDISDYVQQIAQRLETAKQPVILAGHEINSFHLQDELEKFVNQTHIPVAQLSLGKGAFNEENEHYLGIYDGEIAETHIKDYVNHSDLILTIGAKLTDSATAGFSHQFNMENVVTLNHKHLKINDVILNDVSLTNILEGLLKLNYCNTTKFPAYEKEQDFTLPLNDEPLSQQNYFTMIQSFIKPEDIIIAEQGSSFFGAYNLSLYRSNTFIGQPLWGSIGYTLPATLGTQIANPNRRNLLLIGDGSLQLTVQALSTMIRQQLKPVIFVINNDGYTVERLIHGMYEPYNDIQMWNYQALPAVFGGEQVAVHDALTTNDLQNIFQEIDTHNDRMHVVEVKMAIEDAPAKLRDIAQAFSSQNQ
ncbi:alpha-keto acid decarboxylase family protein [Staphylococcus rostri]|uniref:Alpha-keto-acid decarboxylase n=1 Tax=Staphylococcus rostri TaxID=522262 RepID=A0A2K3YU17_9STAP|nr:alpha-keto acid decarboxylase family protein [Staphylococcus rostri]PNZ29112.1 pyruvate decarboxylase [Staphylococcus rostri]